MSAVRIAQDIYWVGAVDWNIRHFHGHTYTTKRGTTYNSYLILDKKNALVDTVHAPFSEELFGNISRIVPLEKIDYIIANHVETDHSGALPALLKSCPKAKVLGTGKCKEGLAKQYGLSWGTVAPAYDFQVIKTGDILKLGKRSLSFIEAPMIHWPDSMFTYCPEEQLLMPNDAFGQHYATSERFDDEVPEAILMEESAKYYANILWPLGTVISKKIEEVQKSKVPIKMIAPSHGIIWRKSPEKIVNRYLSWANNSSQPRIVVVYETMWGATEKMARTMAQGIIDAGLSVKLYDITQSDRTEIITDMLEARGFLVGSSTHDNNILPNLAGFMELLKGFKPRNRIGGAFGSYGWAGGAVKEIEDILKQTGITIVQPALSIRYMPDEAELRQCYEYGRQIADAVTRGIETM